MALATNRFIKNDSSSQIKIVNRIFRCERELRFKIGDNDYSVKILFPNHNHTSKIKSGVCIDDKLLYEFTIEDEFISYLLNGNSDIDELKQFPKEFKNILIELAFEQLLDRLEKHCNCSSTIVELPIDHLNSNEKFSFQFKVLCETDQSEFLGAISTNNEGMFWLLEKYEQLPRVTAIKFSQIPLAVKFECGHSLLKISEIANIELYDIVLIDDGLSPGKSHLDINIGSSLTLIGQVTSENRITILQKSDNQMERKMETQKENDGFINDTHVNDIPVHLVFQVGETQLKFGDLIHLQPGFTFELDNEMNQQVKIKANGKTIGFGELVEIGERLGVRVIEFEHNNV
jgi:type III secretion protein Q